MRKPFFGLLCVLVLSFFFAFPTAADSPTNKAALKQMARSFELKLDRHRQQQFYDLLGSTDRVWPGGGSGHNLSGSSTATNQFAVWDGGQRDVLPG